MIGYLIQICLATSIWWAIYRLFFKGKAAPKVNRYFLLLGLILPFVVPLIPINQTVVQAAQPTLLPPITVTAQQFISVESSHENNLVFGVYLLGVCAVLLYNFSGIWAYFKIKKNAQKHSQSNIYRTPENVMPFSFFGAIFLPANLSADQQRLIVKHENWHLKLKHSIDVAWAATVQALLWFHPVIFFYIRDLREEHEFEVDQKMLDSVAFNTYAQSLLHARLLPIGHAQFTNYANKTLKKRFKMMTNNNNKNTWKLLAMVPLLVAITYLSACNSQSNELPEQPKAAAMAEVDVLPQFTNCAQTDDKEEQKKCFNHGIVQQIMNGLDYPESAKEANVEGTIYIAFVIDDAGKLSKAEVRRSISKTPENEAAVADMEAAALAVFSSFPEMRPAVAKGKAVAMEYIVPIKFALPKAEEDKDGTEKAYGPKVPGTIQISSEKC